MGWTQEQHDKVVQLYRDGWTYEEQATIMTKEFNKKFTNDSCRNRLRRTNEIRKKDAIEEDYQEEDMPSYKETFEIKSDGSQFSDKLIQLSEAEMKNPNSVMEAHGYDPNEWEMINVKSSLWHHLNKKMDNPKTLHACKITVKPKVNGFDWDKVIDKMNNVKHIEVQKHIEGQSDSYLNIALFDMHFGPADYEYYKPTQSEVMSLIEQGHKEVLFIIGQDLLHNNDFKGNTANGTPIEKFDMEKAFKDAILFYEPLIFKAIEKSEKVSIVYSRGNHDETISWAFVQRLIPRFPQVEFNDNLDERKVHMLGKNFIGINHGDKKKEDKLTENFATEFPIQWSGATTREILTGHLHTERVVDKGGVVLRRMPTGNVTDDWHKDKGYTTAHKRFEILEYTETKVKRIHYV